MRGADISDYANRISDAPYPSEKRWLFASRFIKITAALQLLESAVRLLHGSVGACNCGQRAALTESMVTSDIVKIYIHLCCSNRKVHLSGIKAMALHHARLHIRLISVRMKKKIQESIENASVTICHSDLTEPLTLAELKVCLRSDRIQLHNIAKLNEFQWSTVQVKYSTPAAGRSTTSSCHQPLSARWQLRCSWPSYSASVADVADVGLAPNTNVRTRRIPKTPS